MGMGFGMGFGGIWMLLILVLVVQAIDNPELTRIAGQVRDMLADVVKEA